MEPTWQSPESWQKDGSTISGVTSIKTGAFTSILAAKQTLAGRTSDVVIKSFTVAEGIADPQRITTERERFLTSARLQYDLNSKGAQAWVRIYKISDDAEHPSFSMEKCGPSIKDLLDRKVQLTAKDLYALVHSVLQAFIELKDKHNRSHGSLKPSDILSSPPGIHPPYKITDPAAKGEDHSANDLYALGQIIVLLIEHKDYDPLTQLLPTRNWERFGSRRDRWIQFCNLLLSPNGCHEPLRNVKREAFRLKPSSALFPVLGCLGILIFLGVGAIGYHFAMQKYYAWRSPAPATGPSSAPAVAALTINPQVKSAYESAHQKYQEARTRWTALTPTTRYDHTQSRALARDARTYLPDQVILTDEDSYKSASEAYTKAADSLSKAITQLAAEEAKGQELDSATANAMNQAKTDYTRAKEEWDVASAKFAAGQDHSRSTALAQAAIAISPKSPPTDPGAFEVATGQYHTATSKLRDALGLLPEENLSGASQGQAKAAFDESRTAYLKVRDQWNLADQTRDVDLTQPRALAAEAKAMLPEQLVLTDAGSYRSAADLYQNAAKKLQQALSLVDQLKKASTGDLAAAIANANQALRDKKYPDALNWYKKAADLGSPAAMHNVGLLYETGQGATQDYAEAAKWYRKAADLNDRAAMYDLALLLQNGRGVQKDLNEAVTWLQKAADLQSTQAMCNLGVLYEIGRGVPQDYATALSWFRKAAALNDSTAITNVGVFHEKGYGVSANPAEAMNWYRKAADLNNRAAMYNIGVLYDKGRGVRTDYGEALKWYHKAADAGYPPALCAIGSLYDNGLGVPASHTEALNWFRKAADASNGMAMYNIGVVYENGRGVPRDLNEALNWYRKAAKSTDEDAQTLAIQALDRIAAGR